MAKKRPAWQSRLSDSAGNPDPRRANGERRLTPEAVRNRKFTTTRLMQGYDVAEVDAFLDEVTNEMARLIRERDEARAAATGPPLQDEVP